MDDFKLYARDLLDGIDVGIGEVALCASRPKNIMSIAPFKGQGITVDDALISQFKVGLPTVGSLNTWPEGKLLWTGQGLWFALGDISVSGLVDALDGRAAVSDQSDAWAVFTLTGSDAMDVMARLCPLDFLTLEAQVVRTEFAYMMSIIIPIDGGFEIMVMRSFTKTVIEHVRGAMTRVAAQKRL